MKIQLHTWAVHLLWLPTALQVGRLAVQAGTVAHYRFEDGTNSMQTLILVDSGPNALHGSPVGGGALSYSDAVAPYPECGTLSLRKHGGSVAGVVPHDPAFALAEAFTVEFFFQPRVAPYEEVHEPQVLLAKNLSADPGSPAAWVIDYRSCTKEITARVRFEGEPDADFYGTLSGYPEEAWHHVALAYRRHGNSGDTTLYVNGQVATASGSDRHTNVLFGAGPLFIGGCDATGTEGLRGDFNGRFDEVRISDVALEPSQFVADLSPRPLIATIVPKVEISWPSLVGTLYRVEWCSELNTNEWFPLQGGQLYGVGFVTRVDDPLGVHQKRFYRIVIVE